MNELLTTPPFRHLIPGILLASLIFLGYQVLHEFLLSLIWAFILAYVTWPAYHQLRFRLKNRNTLSAALMTFFIALFLLLTVYWLVSLLQEELKTAYQALSAGFAQGSYQLPEEIARIPWLGEYLQDSLDRLNSDKTGLAVQLADWMKQWLGEFAKFLGNIGRYVIKLGVVLVTLFFCFRDGDEAIRQLHQGVVRFLGKKQDIYLQAAGNTTRAVVYGLVIAALGQGILAGVGYSVAGVKAPVLFGAITALLALVPMGATLVWMPIAIALILGNQFWAGTGLLLWGVLVVSTVDNVIRPIVISGASRVPFLVVLFGVLGGLNAFGIIGLFLGPVILAVLLAVWQAWLEQQSEQDALLNHNVVTEKQNTTLPDLVKDKNGEEKP